MRVLIPVDWSDNSRYAFDWYLSCLHEAGSSIIMVHYIDAANDREMQAKEIKLMELQETYETQLLKRKIDYHWIAGNEGSPGEYIVKVADEEDATIIVMGCRGLGKLRKAILGSVSDHVVQRSRVPVIVCKRP